jgi:sec-independent protein translocase protein TatC
MMIHHVREIQVRLLITVLVLIAGMVAGYFFYEPLFQFIKAPLNGPLHYTSPAGSFSFVIKICLMVGVITTLPVAVYNIIMFVQPALKRRLSRARVYITTFLSLVLASGGAAFAFLVIIPLALQFFYKFQVDGLVALISADDYLKFVVNVVITFVVIFQLPLIISLIDHIRPLPPMKLLKAEKYIIVGSVAIGVLVPFALDPTVQFLIASPIIVLYNLSIGVVVLQHALKKRHAQTNEVAHDVASAHEAQAVPVIPPQPVSVSDEQLLQPQVSLAQATSPAQQPPARRVAMVSDIKPPQARARSAVIRPAARPTRLISDMRRPSRPPVSQSPQMNRQYRTPELSTE